MQMGKPAQNISISITIEITKAKVLKQLRC